MTIPTDPTDPLPAKALSAIAAAVQNLAYQMEINAKLSYLAMPYKNQQALKIGRALGLEPKDEETL